MNKKPINSIQNKLMINDLKLAKKNLIERGLTLSIVNDGKTIFESTSHGISGLLRAIEEFGGRLAGSSVADRIAGKAVALLCVHAKAEAIYAETLSRVAKEVFEDYSIYHEWDELVENICGFDGKQICPFEKLAIEISNPQCAYERLKALSFSLKSVYGKRVTNSL